VQVQIDSGNDFSLDDSALYREIRRRDQQPAPSPPSDLGASLRLENLLEASNDISSDELKPVNAFGQAVSARTRALHQTQDVPKESTTAPELDVDSEAVRRRIARLAKAATKQQQALPAVFASRDCPALLPVSTSPRRTTRRACRHSAAAPASAPRRFPSTHTRACCTSPASCCASRCSA
jgi:hypothetical protein